MFPIFLTDSGLPVPAVTADQMVEVDRIALEETGPNRFQMMENTGCHLAHQAIDCLRATQPLRVLPQSAPAESPHRVVVLAGGGMNGGGGICAARHLANQGLDVRLCLSDVSALTDISRWQYHLFQASPGGEITVEALVGNASDRLISWDGDPVDGVPGDPCKVDDLGGEPAALIVDALMGCRVSEAPQGNDLALINWANGSGIPLLSLDVPSGMDATLGETPGAVMQARWTMTLALPKTGLRPEKTGELILADIGIPAKTYRAKSLKLPYRSPFLRGYRVPLYYSASVTGVA
jgi:NAD(P)H-hydrate epimerase